MIRFVCMMILSIVLMTGGCGDRSQTPVSLRSFILHDVQGLDGGQALWVDEDGSAILQVVRPSPPEKKILGLWEKRYTLKLSDQQKTEVEQMASARHILAIKTGEKYGIPDEANRLIVLVTTDGQTFKVSRWDHEKHPDFNAFCGYLQGLCHPPPGEKPIYEGAFDWDWRPDGFERPW